MLLGLFCPFKTSTIYFVHFYDIITAENVETITPLIRNNFFNPGIIMDI